MKDAPQFMMSDISSMALGTDLIKAWGNEEMKDSTPGGRQYIELNREAWLLHVDKQGGGIDGKQLDQRDRFS